MSLNKKPVRCISFSPEELKATNRRENIQLPILISSYEQNQVYSLAPYRIGQNKHHFVFRNGSIGVFLFV